MVKSQVRKMRRLARGANSRKDMPAVPNTSLLRYRGPIPQRTAEEGVVVTLRSLSTLSTGVGTSFNVTIDNNPSGYDNWSEYSTSWASYRVLGIRAEFIPIYNVSLATVATAPIISNVLHTATAPAVTTLTDAFSFGDPGIHHTTKKFVREWRMVSPQEALWQPTASPSRTSYCFNFFSSGLTTATTYGYVYYTLLLQLASATK